LDDCALLHIVLNGGSDEGDAIGDSVLEDMNTREKEKIL
jgi:hypothetical protein